MFNCDERFRNITFNIMMLYILSLVLAATLIPVGFAQSSSGGTAASTTSSSTSSAAATHTVAVGADGLVFSPSQLTADVGDVVEFWFYPQNHSVARSDFKSPCIPYEDTGVGRQGFWSGFHPVAVVLSDPPKFQVNITDTEPIFFYCSAPGACINDGMVGVINANATETLEIQQAYAKNATLMFSPGQDFPSEIVPTTSSSSTSYPTAASSGTSSSSSSHSLSTGAIAGVAIGGAAIVILGAALIYLCGRQRTMGELLRSQPRSGPPSYIPAYASSGHPSMASSTAGHPPNIPQFDLNAAPAQRYSAQGWLYEGSVAEMECRRSFSHSPPVEETRERDLMIPSIYIAGTPGDMSPEHIQSPPIRRSVPESPLRPSPISPVGETMFIPLHMESYPAQPSKNSTTNRYDLQLGPHELAVESEPVYGPGGTRNNFDV